MTQPPSKISIDVLHKEGTSYPPPAAASRGSLIPDLATYRSMYQRSLDNPEGFWAEAARDFVWFQPWKKVLSYDWVKEMRIAWFEGAKTNICVNALDRHLPAAKDRLAYLWIGNDGSEKRITYGTLFEDVCRCANVLTSQGVKKGDRVTIYLPMIPELPVAMLACARIGATHSVVFGGFSADSLKDRILDADSRILITSDGAFRGPKTIPLKGIADQAMQLCEEAGHHVSKCIVVRRTQEKVPMEEGRDLEWAALMNDASPSRKPEPMDSEDPLFILYTSGSTGKPKGVLHTTAGYMVFTTLTFRYVFDYRPEDLYFCTADIGWITGHSYQVYGPLCAQASCVLFEGIPNYPHPDRLWEIIEKHKATILYTAPTAIRGLMREGDEWPAKHDLSSLRLLGSVGEPINPEAWLWYRKHIGQDRCPIVDTWWQTETGGILISPLPGATPTKPGSATLPFFGIELAVLRDDGSECTPQEAGSLVIKRPWPGIMRTVYGHHERFRETYFSRFPGVYLTGDAAQRDHDGYYWIEGRMDDVLKVSGHRIGTAEVESALVAHPAVAEAAVVGYPHDVKGQGIYAFVILKQGQTGTHLIAPLQQHVRREIGPIATPDIIQIVEGLPKTRSGKIMRRILRKIAEGKTGEIGDTTTLADPTVVEKIIKDLH